MCKNKFLFLNKLLMVLSTIGLFISFAIALNHTCAGEECEICYFLSIVSLALVAVLSISTFCLFVYVHRINESRLVYKQNKTAITQTPIYKNYYAQDISLITLKIKLQVAM